MSRAIVVTLDTKLVSLTNSREHWRTRAKRAKEQRRMAAAALATHQRFAPGTKLNIYITRIAPRALDSDNNVISGKHVRDGVADWLGVDDGSDLLTWHYSQQRGAAGYYGCRISITEG